MRKKKSSPQLPAIDGEMESGCHYRAYPWRIGKEKARAAFKFRYGTMPDQVFYGKPNGALLYAGPVPGMGHEIPERGAAPAWPRATFRYKKESNQ